MTENDNLLVVFKSEKISLVFFVYLKIVLIFSFFINVGFEKFDLDAQDVLVADWRQFQEPGDSFFIALYVFQLEVGQIERWVWRLEMYIDEKVAIFLRRKLRILQANLQSDILAKVSDKIVCLDS